MVFKLSNFFGTRITPEVDFKEEPRLTHVYVPERTENGVVFSLKCLELDYDRKALLKFSDYSVNALLDAGINPESLHIKIESNNKIGKDSEIIKFNERVDALVDKIFND